MYVTKVGEVVLNEYDILQGLYSGKISNLSTINIEDRELVEQFNNACNQNADAFSLLTVFKPSSLTQDEFDKHNQQSWFMPIEYQNLDISSYILNLCKTDKEVCRVNEELLLYSKYNMIDILKYLKYLVDTMRSNNIVWGVGRGSSTASYCLYLLGLHKINSLTYELDIHEFLK